MRSAAQEQRRQPRAGDCARDETGQRKRTDDQALEKAPDRHQHDEGDDDPVDRGHGEVTLRLGGPRLRVRCGGLAVTDHRQERRRRLIRRLLPAVAAIALIAGFITGALSTPASVRAGRDFAHAWERGDYRAMYDLLADDAKQETSLRAFRHAYRLDATTATLRDISVARVRRRGDGVELTVAARTSAFGTVKDVIEVPVTDG